MSKILTYLFILISFSVKSQITLIMNKDTISTNGRELEYVVDSVLTTNWNNKVLHLKDSIKSITLNKWKDSSTYYFITSTDGNLYLNITKDKSIKDRISKFDSIISYININNIIFDSINKFRLLNNKPIIVNRISDNYIDDVISNIVSDNRRPVMSIDNYDLCNRICYDRVIDAIFKYNSLKRRLTKSNISRLDISVLEFDSKILYVTITYSMKNITLEEKLVIDL